MFVLCKGIGVKKWFFKESFLTCIDIQSVSLYHCINRVIQLEVMVLSFDQNVPIYLQLVEQIRYCIISGELAPGERVLSVREWALQEKVNPNTMQKALMELETEGLLLTERTNGKFVTTDLDLILSCKKKEAEKIARAYYDKMKRIGFDFEGAMHSLEELKGENE